MAELDIFQSDYSAEQIEDEITNGVPRINATNKHWERWDVENQVWVDTGVVAEGTSTGAAWGNITGSISNQTDLNSALSGKESKTDADLLIKNVTYTSADGKFTFTKQNGTTIVIDTNYEIGYIGKTTVFNVDGTITETFANGLVKLTTFVSASVITEAYTYEGVTRTKTITFNADGSITETIA